VKKDQEEEFNRIKEQEEHKRKDRVEEQNQVI